MDAVINLKHEPALREKFEYAPVVNNTVRIDRRTKWGNPWRAGPDGSREEVIARYRADLWRRIREGRDRARRTRGAGWILAGLLVRTLALSWRCPCPRGGLGRAGAGGTENPMMAGADFQRRSGADRSRGHGLVLPPRRRAGGTADRSVQGEGV